MGTCTRNEPNINKDWDDTSDRAREQVSACVMTTVTKIWLCTGSSSGGRNAKRKGNVAQELLDSSQLRFVWLSRGCFACMSGSRAIDVMQLGGRANHQQAAPLLRRCVTRFMCRSSMEIGLSYDADIEKDLMIFTVCARSVARMTTTRHWR